jgi:GntR family L-lactate dehydrogenase operon transcriptional regulator
MRKTDALEAVVLDALRSDAPVGARSIWRQVLRSGHNVSESTVSRVLSDLDARGLTSSLDNKGRLLTPDGQKLVDAARLDEQRRLSFAGARVIRSPDELLDLLAVRRGIERVAVRAAALRATPTELARLQVMLQGEEDPTHPDLWFERIGFHKYVGHMSHNKPIQAITNAIFEDTFDVQERLIFLVTREFGTWGQSATEHELIAQAIAERAPDRAEQLMLSHLDRLIREIEDYVGRESKEVLDRLFSSDFGQPGPKRPKRREK